MSDTCVLHLSDLHIGKKGKAEGLETVVKMIEDHYSPNETIILITGDITEHGQKRQFKLARKLLNPLYEWFEVLCVPGNHDYGYLGNHAEKRRFNHFKRYLYGLENVSYPHVRIFNEHIFIGLNSMKGELGGLDSFWANGELGEKQLGNLNGVLGRIKSLHQPWRRVLVYLHHHPFLFPHESESRELFEELFFELKDGEKLMQICAGRIDALLFGHKHNHINFSGTSICEDWDIPVILSCAQSSDRGTEKQIHIYYRAPYGEQSWVRACDPNPNNDPNFKEEYLERDHMGSTFDEGQSGLLGHLLRLPSSDGPIRAETVVF